MTEWLIYTNCFLTKDTATIFFSKTGNAKNIGKTFKAAKVGEA